MRTSTEAHDGHILRIAPKLGDVILHPGEQRLLVLQPQVEQALLGRQRRRQKPECADAVVEADGHNVRFRPRHEAGHVPLAAVAGIEAASVDVDDHWQAVGGFGDTVHLARNPFGTLRAEDIDVQAVLAFRPARVGAETGVPVGGGLERRGRFRKGHSRSEAVLARS